MTDLKIAEFLLAMVEKEYNESWDEETKAKHRNGVKYAKRQVEIKKKLQA